MDSVAVAIFPDIPDPRCVIVSPDQMLKVVNRKPETIEVGLGNLEASIPPNGEYVFHALFGEYLAMGVHLLQVYPCCGGSIWLKGD